MRTDLPPTVVYVVVEIDSDDGVNFHRVFADAAKAEALAAKIRSELQYGDVYVAEVEVSNE